MKRVIVLLMLMLDISLASSAQKPARVQIDSMLLILPHLKKDTSKVKILKSISYDYFQIQPDSGIYWGEEGIKLSQELGWKIGKAMSLSSIGTNYYAKKDWDKALECYDSALSIANKSNNKILAANYQYNIARTYQSQNKFSDALEWYYHSLESANGTKDKKSVFKAHLGIGYVNQLLGHLETAIEHYKKAQEAATQERNEQDVLLSSNNVAVIYVDLGDFPKALEIFLECYRTQAKLGNTRFLAISAYNIGDVFRRQSDTANAKIWAFKTLQIAEEAGLDDLAGASCLMIGDHYADVKRTNQDTVLKWYRRALIHSEKAGEWETIIGSYGGIGDTYCSLSIYDSARFFHRKALSLARSAMPGNEYAALAWLGNGFLNQAGDSGLLISEAKKCELLDSAVFYLDLSTKQYLSRGANAAVSNPMFALSKAYVLMDEDARALNIYKTYTSQQDLLFNAEEEKKLLSVEVNYAVQKGEDSILFEENKRKLELDNAVQIEVLQRENERKQMAAERNREQQQLQFQEALKEQTLADSLALQTAAAEEEYQKESQLAAAAKDRRISAARENMHRQQTSLTVSLGGATLLLLVGLLSFWAYRERATANLAISREQKKSESLLQNVLPVGVAVELKEQGHVVARIFDETSVLFTDFVDFTATAQSLSPQVIVKELHECFSAFDAIIRRNGLEKIKSIGDTYMAVCGLPQSDPKHAQRCVQAATEILEFMQNRSKREKVFKIRIGINSGPVLAGVVGVHKFAYDIWGDTVNTAARMEQHGEAGAINISQSTYDLVKKDFNCSYRGEIAAKNKGEVAMYFVEGKKGTG